MSNKSVKHEAETNCQLLTHTDFLHQILLKLPATSLARFKAVCKQWCSLISDPCFVTRHVHISNYSEDISRMRILRLNLSYSIKPAKYIEIKPYPFSEKDYARVLGSCNGLFLVRSTYQTISLWNPTTRECKDISPESPCFRNYFGYIEGPYTDCLFGLGYDSSSGDYKAVILIVNNRSHDLESRLFICSSRTGVWKDVEHDLTFSAFAISSAGVTVNGCPHWVVHDLDYILRFYDRHKHNTIVYFDMADDKFKRVPLPVSWSCEYNMEISIMRGHLCTVLRKVDHFDVWEMKKHGAEESWTKLCGINVSNLNWLYMPLGFKNTNSEVVMAATRLKKRRYQSKIVRYNLKTRGKKCAINLIGSLQDYRCYIPSLVSPFSFGLMKEQGSHK